MSRKRRMFDVDLPEPSDAPQAGAPEVMPELEVKSMSGRRGPMATAIGETGESLRRRAEVEAEIRAENDTLAHEFVRLKRLGLITDLVPVDAVQSVRLVRDRSRRLDPDLDDLKASIRAIGLSNPIRVEPVAGGYELVQGWRRLSAYRALYEETGDAQYATIPASLMPKGETLEGLYRRMVDENLVRKDISWAEMARLAMSCVSDGVEHCDDLDAAVNMLFASANPQKRSYIRRFALLLSRLEKHLEHPEAIPRALGLTAAHRLEVDPMSVSSVVRQLQAAPGRSAAEEVAILRAWAAEPPAISPQGNPVRGRPAKAGKTTLRLPVGLGEVRCTAQPGKIEMRIDRDFSVMDRVRLEAAVEAFFAALEGQGDG